MAVFTSVDMAGFLFAANLQHREVKWRMAHRRYVRLKLSCIIEWPATATFKSLSSSMRPKKVGLGLARLVEGVFFSFCNGLSIVVRGKSRQNPVC